MDIARDLRRLTLPAGSSPAPTANGARTSAGGEGRPSEGSVVRRRRRLLVNIAVIAVTVLFCYVALSHLRLGEGWKAVQRSDFWWLIPALGAFALGNVARALRWRSLFPAGRRPPRATTLNAMMIGYLYNNILPARAGEPARVAVLTQRSSSPAVEITGTVALERLYDVLGILAIFFLAWPWLPHVSWFKAAAIVAIALVTAIAIAATVLTIFGDRPLRVLLNPLRRFSPLSEERLERWLGELVHGLSGLRDWRVAIPALILTIVAWFMSILCAYFVILAVQPQLPFAAAVLVLVAIGASMILPSPPAAVGVFEGATLLALHAYGLSHSVALPYALVLHLVNFVPFVVVGVLLLHYNSRHPSPGLVGQADLPGGAAGSDKAAARADVAAVRADAAA
jgi:glycosyltransferase 2 family protein